MSSAAIRQSQRYVSPPKREEFNHRVWSLVRQIPPGKVCTYGQIAALLGSSPGDGSKELPRLRCSMGGWGNV